MGGVGRRWWGREGGDELEEHKWQGWNWNPGTLGQSLSPVPTMTLTIWGQGSGVFSVSSGPRKGIQAGLA